MNNFRINKIRKAEAYSHSEAYKNLRLFEPGSWLAKPVQTVVELVALFSSRSQFHGLDLGCGIGRNCIPVLQSLSHIPCQMDCVDILPLAIEKLLDNADKYGVAEKINGIVCSVDRFPIQPEFYDLILGISVLEHLDSVETLDHKLQEIFNGIRPGGIACFVINTAIEEHNRDTGESVDAQFEINLQACDMEARLNKAFSGTEVLKKTLSHYQYDTYRESGIVVLDTDVLTYVVRKRD